MTNGYAPVCGKIKAAVAAAGRDAASVKLIAVSKTFAEADILPVIEAGQRLFGENRVQEAKAKWPPLTARFPDVELHLIGPLQSNKVREAVALFDVIHTVDRPKIAEALAAEIARSGSKPRLLVEVNTGAEPQKAGVMPDEAEAFVARCRGELGLAIEGLMCIPPFDADPVPHFRLLAGLRGKLGLTELSMGMSADFEAAIACGATYIRVGTAIFGGRAHLT
jgi:pyridoxal phosphate enzyme (YggS family)